MTLPYVLGLVTIELTSVFDFAGPILILSAYANGMLESYLFQRLYKAHSVPLAAKHLTYDSPPSASNAAEQP
jgi:hypothetical protein